MSRRVLVDHGELVPKPEVKICRDDVDIASQTEAHSGPCWDRDQMLFGLWPVGDPAKSHAADDHRYGRTEEKDQ